ncbi:MAG: HEAT repeat domain-containing protein [Planctomycetota bacterium]
MRTSHRVFCALAVVMAVCVSVASAGDRQKAARDLGIALKADDAKGIEAACDELMACGGKEAFRCIASSLVETKGAAYWQLVGAASGFKDRGALDELASYVVENLTGAKAAVARDLVFGLQNNRASDVVNPIARILEKGAPDMKLAAVDYLAAIDAREATDALRAALEREAKGEPELRRRIENALAAQKKPETPAASAADAKATTREKPRDGEFLRTVAKLPAECIKVVTSEAEYDDLAAVLTRHSLAHTKITWADLEKNPKRALERCQALLVDCGDDDASPKVRAAIKAWVEEGGFLYTEDFGIDLTATLWPSRVGTSDSISLDTMRVSLIPRSGNATHPLMRGVWQKPLEGATKESPARRSAHTWQIDALSMIAVVKDASVTVLFESPDLKRPAQGHTAVAITFDVDARETKAKRKGGAVLHTLSHWGTQPTSQDGEALENLLVNFLLEAAKRHEK